MKNHINAPTTRLWISRILIAIVFFFNIQCAFTFLTFPQLFAGSFELSGEVGQTWIRALGILFTMWNVPYAVALWHPVNQRVSLWEAVVMQGIGFAGETILLLALPGIHPVLNSTVQRFIFFDGGGFLALLLSIWLISPSYTR